MHPLRITGVVLLAVAVLFALIMMFVPMGEAWTESGGLRTEEEYGFWGKDRMFGQASGAGGASVTESSWSDGDMDGSGGITYLRMAGPLVLIGLLLAVAGLVLTAIPKTGKKRMPAWFILPAFIAMILGLLVWVLGVDLHAQDNVHAQAGIQMIAWLILPIIVIALLIAAFVLGLIIPPEYNVREVHHYHEARVVDEHEHHGHEHHEHHAHGEGWHMVKIRCPSCQAVHQGFRGEIMTCHCGFSKAVPA